MTSSPSALWYESIQGATLSDGPSKASFKSSSHHPSTSLTKMMNSAASTSTRKTRRRNQGAKLSVKFDEREASVIEFGPCEEAEDLWFSKQEIKSFREECRVLLKKVQDAGGNCSVLDGSRGECFRGLEHGLHNNDEQSRPASSDKLMEDLPLGRSQKRKNILQAVLAQQRETKEMGLQDPKGLSVTSTHQTKWAKNRAITQAEKDFETACQIWMEEKQYCSKLLPSVLGPKMMEQIFRGHVFVADDTPESPEQRRATLEMVSQAVSSALAELEDMDELDF